MTRTGFAPAVALCLAITAGARNPEAVDPSRALTQYQIDRWEAAQGLPQSTVQAMTVTGDGYLWVGTLDGLARFDGRRFTVFDGRTVPELGTGSILGLMQDAAGDLWIGRSGAAVVYKGGAFRVVFGEEVTQGATVWSFCQARDGAVWAATNNGLVRWEKGVSRVYRRADGLPTDRLRSLAFDGDGTLWIGTTGGGLVSFAEGRFTTLNPGNGFPSAEVRAVLPDPQGGVWAATAGGGLAHVHAGRVRTYTTADGLPTNQLSALALDGQGTLWLGTWGAGVCRLAAGRFSCLSSSGGLAADQVWSLLADREGSVWIGTWVGGLNRLRDRRFLVVGAPEGLSSDNVRAVLHARDGAMWAATAGGGVNRIGTDGVVTAIRAKDGLPSDEASSLCEDRDGSLWVGTYTSGVARLRNGRITAFAEAQGLPGVDVRSLFQDRAGTLWAGTMKGLARFDGTRFAAVAAAGIPLDGIVAMYEDRTGTLWFGTAAQGLIRYRAGTFAAFSTQDGLGSNRILAFHEDARGSLWLGSGAGGITRLREGRFVAIRPSDGLWDGVAQTMIEDRAGQLWMTCNRGFFSVPLRELDEFADGRRARVTSTAYGQADGLRNATFAGGQSPSGAVDERGRIWLPSYKGLVVFDPLRIPARVSAPAVRIEQVRVNGVTHDVSRPLSLPPGGNLVSIGYTAVTLRDADRVRFRWLMEGLSAEWVSAGDGREAVFPNLAYGRYRFRAASSIDGEVWSEPSAPFEIAVRPYFYQTGWFAILVVLGSAGAVAGGLRWRLRQHRWREAELQSRVTRALADIHTLRGLLPICAWCKKVRNDGGYWEQIEVYVRDRSKAEFSHGICPECEARVANADSLDRPPVP